MDDPSVSRPSPGRRLIRVTCGCGCGHELEVAVSVHLNAGGEGPIRKVYMGRLCPICLTGREPRL